MLNSRVNLSKYMCKREVDATEFERLQLHAHSQTHPKATQSELSHWFYTTFYKFNKQINQSTAMGSRNVESYM